MADKLPHIRNLRLIFQSALLSVQPVNLLSEENGYSLRPKCEEDERVTIQIQGKPLDITNKHCHVVGFGKAVLGMAIKMEQSLGKFLRSGVISIPTGSFEQSKNPLKRVQVFQGAENNQPDENALNAALAIKNLASSMTSNDILFVLISGGGSALLPMPRSSITLTDKMQLVRNLSNRGATIQEMNTVRIALSDIKGGRLAEAAGKAHAVISFVISDIVGDSVDLIASGPTCAQIGKRANAKEVLIKHEMWDETPLSIKQIIETELNQDAASENEEPPQPNPNNSIYVVGDNGVAAATAVREGLACGYNPFIVSTTLTGDVEDLVKLYTVFLQSICDFRLAKIEKSQLKAVFPFDARTFQHFLKTLQMSIKTDKPLMLILGGEPTIKVVGNGLGGRNQELALRMAMALYKNKDFNDISFLSAGTDGFDGPTPAAGAFGDRLVIDEFLTCRARELSSVQEYINNNDSYNFYHNLCHGAYQISTGATGTNVMDLHFILFY